MDAWTNEMTQDVIAIWLEEQIQEDKDSITRNKIFVNFSIIAM